MNKVIKNSEINRIPCHRVDMGFELPANLPDIAYFQNLVSKSNLFIQPEICPNIKKKYETRLNQGVVNYVEKIVSGKDRKRVLDLGCGQGGNRTFLALLGVSDVISFDLSSPVADIIGDAHLLPFKSRSFDLVLATAVIEHLYNPFVAFSEIERILEPGGYLLATASFWESWHDKSCFHFTPNGLYVLCHCSGFELLDLWSPQSNRCPCLHQSIFSYHENSTQPMESLCQNYLITYNGEIYNYLELKKELLNLGFQFKTDHSDTEILLNAYIAWGEKCLLKLQ